MPSVAFDMLCRLSGLTRVEHRCISEKELKSKAGMVGGKKTYGLYGLGDEKSRIKGGKISYIKRRHDPDDMFAPKGIMIPAYSEELAEFVGAMIGDGTVSRYQIAIYGNSVDDAGYTAYLGQQIHRLFGLEPTLSYKKDSQCSILSVSSTRLVQYITSLGLPQGDKIAHGLCIPEWIKHNEAYLKACLRGIFDTDGGVYLEKHSIKQKEYSYMRMAFVSASPPLVEDISDALNSLGFSPTITSGRYVKLQKFTDIEDYFTIVGSSNPKHLERYATFGGVG